MFLLLASVVLAAPIVDRSGDCPGDLEIDVTGFTPGGELAVIASPVLGSDLIPAGPCRDMVVGLDRFRLVTRLGDPDGDGRLLVRLSLSGPVCDNYV